MLVITSFSLRFFLFLKLYDFVRRFLIFQNNLLFKDSFDWDFQIFLVSCMARSFYFVCNFRVFDKDLFQKELLRKRKALDLFITPVNKFTSQVVYHIVITDNEHLIEFFDGLELIFGALSVRSKESNTHKSLKAEIHLWNFILFMVDVLVILIKDRIKVSWQKSI